MGTLARPVLLSSSTVSGLPTEISSVSVLPPSTIVAPTSSSLPSSPSTDQNIPSPSVSSEPPESRFWSNKVAVGATFVAIGTILVGVIFLIVFACLRRRRKMGQRCAARCVERHTTSSNDESDPENWRYSSTLDPFAASLDVKTTFPRPFLLMTGEKESHSEKSVFTVETIAV